ncbi:MAG: MFS transporter [Ruminococcaceae bacterium]|nr:MFS transporter [Oscillospiraceae bacterium]
MVLLVNSIAHFLVDAICVTTLFAAGADGGLLPAAVALYNTLAFSTQCLVGLAVDRLPGGYYMTEDVAAMALVVLGCILPLPYLVRVCLVGVGNSLFHVAAGAMTLTKSRGRAWQLGVFVAPGAFGVTLGTCFPRFGYLLCVLLALCAAAVLYYWPRTPQTLELHHLHTADAKLPWGTAVLLTAAVAVRAFGGAAVSFPWKTGAGAAFAMTGFVFAGKALGGFACDRFGAKRTAWISLLPAAVCIAFMSAFAGPSLVGQFLLNLTMPVTLWLLYRAMPAEPGFAFGLAAAALWPGTVAGMLCAREVPLMRLCVAACFAFGIAAILYAANRLEEERT